jgi:hypothetical protein
MSWVFSVIFFVFFKIVSIRSYGGFLNPCKWYDLSNWFPKSYRRLPKSYFYMKHMGEIMLVKCQTLPTTL